MMKSGCKLQPLFLIQFSITIYNYIKLYDIYSNVSHDSPFEHC